MEKTPRCSAHHQKHPRKQLKLNSAIRLRADMYSYCDVVGSAQVATECTRPKITYTQDPSQVETQVFDIFDVPVHVPENAPVNPRLPENRRQAEKDHLLDHACAVHYCSCHAATEALHICMQKMLGSLA